MLNEVMEIIFRLMNIIETDLRRIKNLETATRHQVTRKMIEKTK